MRRWKLLALDLFLITGATLGAVWLRENLTLGWTSVVNTLPYLLVTLGCASLVLPALGINRTMWRFSGLSDYRRLVIGCAAIVLMAVMIGFAMARNEDIPRSLPIIQGVFMVMLLVGARVLMRAHRYRNTRSEPAPAPGPQQEAVIVFGLSAVAELFIQAVTENPESNIAIAGIIGRSDRHTGHLVRGQPILGTPEELPQILKNLDVHGVTVNRIVVAVGFDKLSEAAKQAILDLENGTQIKVDYFAERLGFTEPSSPKRVAESPAASRGAADRISRSDADPRELMTALSNPYWRTKRWFDIACSAIAILALAPIMVVIGIVNAAVHGFPVVFWQQRPGLNGKPFRVYKFRSLLGAHDEHGQRLPDELRETWFGHFLRSTRLDELPQLLNIFWGHMSFVGPRPLLMNDQLEQFSGRLFVRPGLTGWAQVNGGKTISASDKMALDIWYIHNVSFTLDMKIALLTIYMVVFGERENQDAVEQAWIEIQRNRKISAVDRTAA